MTYPQDFEAKCKQLLLDVERLSKENKSLKLELEACYKELGMEEEFEENWEE